MTKRAQELEDQSACGGWLWLTKVRLAFDDALGVSNSAVVGMGDEKLCPITRKLVDNMRQNPSIDRPLQ